MHWNTNQQENRGGGWHPSGTQCVSGFAEMGFIIVLLMVAGGGLMAVGHMLLIGLAMIIGPEAFESLCGMWDAFITNAPVALIVFAFAALLIFNICQGIEAIRDHFRKD